jgi:hypothetical protein
VLVGVGPVDSELVAVVEEELVSVGGARADDHALAGGDRRVADRRVVHAAAGDEEDRGRDPQTLLDGVGERALVGAHRAFEVGDFEHLVEEVAEELARRREPAGDEVTDERTKLVAAQSLAVDLELEKPGEDVVGDVLASLELVRAALDLVVDVPRELRERGGEPLAALGSVRAGKLAHHERARPRRDRVGVLGREAEEVDRDAVGQRHRERRHQISAAGDRHAVEETLGRAPDERLGGVDDLGGEGGDHDPTNRGVVGRVELAEDPVLFRDLDAGRLHPGRVRERVGVAQHPTAFGMPGDVVHAARDGRHRTVPAQLLQQRPGALRLPRIERIKLAPRHRTGA